jgi:hypothetical protein
MLTPIKLANWAWVILKSDLKLAMVAPVTRSATNRCSSGFLMISSSSNFQLTISETGRISRDDFLSFNEEENSGEGNLTIN